MAGRSCVFLVAVKAIRASRYHIVTIILKRELTCNGNRRPGHSAMLMEKGRLNQWDG